MNVLASGHRSTEVSNIVNFMVTPCINNIQHFNYQLMHTTLKNVELLKHFKIQDGSNMTGTDLYVNKPHCAAAVRP